jgi:hypothetical protein
MLQELSGIIMLPLAVLVVCSLLAMLVVTSRRSSMEDEEKE